MDTYLQPATPATGEELNSDAIWVALYPRLLPLVKRWVYASNTFSWIGQEADVAWDIVLVSIQRTYEYTLKARRENIPIASLQRLSITIAKHYFQDLRRKDYRLQPLARDGYSQVERSIHDETNIEEAVLEEYMWSGFLVGANLIETMTFHHLFCNWFPSAVVNRSVHGDFPMSKMITSDTKEKERVQLDFTSDALRRLDQLKKVTGATTRAETIRQALRLYEWFVEETEPDSTVQILDKTGKPTSMFKAILLHSATRPTPVEDRNPVSARS